MKIGILLPYKENFSPEYPGAVSLFVNETSLKSRFKNNIVVFGSTNFKKKFKLRYKNINLFPNPLKSQTKSYVKKFIQIQKKFNFSIIEIHNRPSSYIDLLKKDLNEKVLALYFHNDPLSMDGSKTIKDRKNLLKVATKLYLIVIGQKKGFLEGLENKFVNSEKLVVFFQSAKKNNVKILKKKKNG